MKNFLVIGASSGIGKRIAEILAEEGQQVFGTYLTHEMETDSDRIQYHRLNVTDNALDLSFLPEVLHGVVYCPGSINLKPFHRIKPENFIEDFNLQVVGAIKILQTALPRLKAAGSASVVLFSTVAVSMGFNFHSQVAASKGAIEGLVRSLAAEWAPNIRVNAIAPSLTDTPMGAHLLNSPEKKEANAQRHPLKRVGTPDDIARTAQFLLSENSGWITGQIIHTDGGMSAIRG